jgi:hypothetical protein
MEILGAIVLAAAMIYAIIERSRRRRAKAEVSDAATRGVHPETLRQEDMEERMASSSPRVPEELPANPRLRGELRSGRDEGRLSEDEIAREHLGVTGRGDAAKAKALDERETQINKHLDPGHTA